MGEQHWRSAARPPPRSGGGLVGCNGEFDRPTRREREATTLSFAPGADLRYSATR